MGLFERNKSKTPLFDMLLRFTRLLVSCIIFSLFMMNCARSKDSDSKAKVCRDNKNGYFMFLPPKEWTPQLYSDPRTKVAFNHPVAREVLIRFIVRESTGETFDTMISQDKRIANQMKAKGISCKIQENDILGLKCSEVFIQFPNDRGTTMIRKFLSSGLHFNVQYFAPTKALFDKYRDEAMKSLNTIVILKVSTGDAEKAIEQQVAGRIRLAKLMAQLGNLEEARLILHEAEREFPNSKLIQGALKELEELQGTIKQ